MRRGSRTPTEGDIIIVQTDEGWRDAEVLDVLASQYFVKFTDTGGEAFAFQSNVKWTKKKTITSKAGESPSSQEGRQTNEEARQWQAIQEIADGLE